VFQSYRTICIFGRTFTSWMPSQGLCDFLPRLIKLLSSYSGRDKAIRVLHFSLALLSNQVRNKHLSQHLTSLAKQLSHSRLVWRQLSHLSLIDFGRKQLQELGTLLRETNNAPVDVVLACSITILYTILAFVETIAWLADAKILPAHINSAQWFKYSLYLWVCALTVGVIKNLVRLYNLLVISHCSALDSIRESLTALSALLMDLIAATNSLRVPFPFSLLGGNNRLSPKQASTCFLIASLIGLYSLF